MDNKKNNILIKTIVIVLISMVISTTSAFAQLGDISPPNNTVISINDVVSNLITFAIGSGAALFLILFMWGSLEWLMSAGDKMHLEKARGRIVSAVIGLILLACVFAILQIVKAVTFDPSVVAPGAPSTPVIPGNPGGPGVNCNAIPTPPQCQTPI